MSFLDKLNLYASQTENRFASLFPQFSDACSPRLREAIDYSLLGGGKRIRAYLTMEFCALCGKDHNYALDYACSLEMVHAFSLIHDDLPAMDNDDMRRGKPSNHKAFGEATAILAGDSLALDAFKVVCGNNYCSAEQNMNAAMVLSDKSGSMGMCSGQQFDIDGEGKALSQTELTRLVDLKTGALFSCACMMGCIAADKNAVADIAPGQSITESQKRIFSAEHFGLLMGRAFQITDDLLDIRSTAKELGKTVGKDIRQQKSTFPALMGEENAEKYAEDCIRKAKECLNCFSDGEAKTRLNEFCDYILTRRY